MSQFTKWGMRLAVLVSSAFISLWLHSMGIWQKFEFANLDNYLLTSSVPPDDAIVLVNINDQDFQSRDLFAGASPLSKRIIVQLVNRLLTEYGAALVVVDIDTSSWTDRDGLQKPQFVVWTMGTKTMHSNHDRSWHVSVNPILAGSPACEMAAGLPLLSPDADGFFRRFSSTHSVLLNGRWTRVRSLSNAAEDLRKNNDAPACQDITSKEPTVTTLIRFAGPGHSFVRLSAGSLIADNALVLENDVRGRVVFLGGTFQEARDTIPTPLGPQTDGLEVNAHILQTIRQGAPREATVRQLFVADLVLGGIATVLMLSIRPGWNLLLVLGFIPLMSIGASKLLYSVFSFFASFVGVPVSMALHVAIEQLLHAGSHTKGHTPK